MVLTLDTPLSEARRLSREYPLSPAEGRKRLVRSVGQSLRLEGYEVTESDVRATTETLLVRTK